MWTYLFTSPYYECYCIKGYYTNEDGAKYLTGAYQIVKDDIVKQTYYCHGMHIFNAEADYVQYIEDYIYSGDSIGIDAVRYC